MAVRHIAHVKLEKMEMEGAKDVELQWLIDKSVGAENFAMRRFVIKPGGHTPLHSHPWEHENYVLEGKGVVRIGDKEYELKKDMFVFIPPDVVHQFRNSGDKDFVLLCLIPL